MTGMTEPRATPPGWLNSLMRRMLRTPGIEKLVGRGTCLLTFTGRNSGKTYTTPISYVRDGDCVLLTCHPSRQWWKNLEFHPDVVVRMRGRDIHGRARVVGGDEATDLLAFFFAEQPMLARAMGLKRTRGEAYPRPEIERVSKETIVVAVDTGNES